MKRFMCGTISQPPDFAAFPYTQWVSGSRSMQMSAVNTSNNYMTWLSTVWREVRGTYAEETGCADFGTLCSGPALSRAFGHGPVVSRRLSETMQDSFDSFI